MRLSSWQHAWRSLVRRPAYFIAATATLACGAGITTAVFSLVDTVLLKPLPYPAADQLVTLYESSPAARDRTSLIAPGRLEDWNRLSRSFEALSASYSENVTDTSGAEPERLVGVRVAPRFFTVYAVPPLAGRYFTSEEEQDGGPGAAVISEALWTRRFSRQPSAVGASLVIGGRLYQVVGVAPATFTSAATDVWLPAQTPQGLMRVREARFMSGVGRLRPGVTVESGAANLAAVQDALAREFPKTDAGWSVEVRPLRDARIGDARRGLVLVFGSVALLWLIAVANIAGLTLVQVSRRARELALRAALGASRGVVVATVVREGLILSVLGGAFGTLLAFWMVSIMPALLAGTPRINELRLDWRALAFVAASSVGAALVCGLVPALAGTRERFAPLVAASSRLVGPVHHRLQRALVVCQVALSVLLVASATLLLRSYYTLTHSETGFDATSVVTFHVAARWDEDRTRIGRLQQQLLTALAQLPHVQAAGMTNFLPATGATLRYQVKVDGIGGPNDDGSMTVGTRMVSGGYLRAIRAPLVSGSWCPEPVADTNAPLHAMVNRRFVDLFAPTEEVVGRTLAMAAFTARFTIAGVVGNLVEDGHATGAAPYVYTCNPAGAWPDPEYVVRTADANALTADVKRLVGGLDATRAVFGLRPLQAVLDASLDRPRFDTTVLVLFAAAASVLAAIGQYSLFMLVVSQRAREMAVRLAIGAEPRQVIRLVLTGAGRLVAGGLVLGVVLTIVANRLLESVLFGVSPGDPTSVAAAMATLVIVSAAAVAGPALRAARIAPSDALRAE
jgi:predicted permease